MEEKVLKESIIDLSAVKSLVEKPRLVATLTPIRCRKIAPIALQNNLTWCQDDMAKCDVINIQSKTSYPNSSDDDKSGLLTSSSDGDASSTSTDNTDDQPSTTCIYIKVEEKVVQCEQLTFLPSINNKCQSFDDECVSLEKFTRKHARAKKPLFKFLCPPYFILAASILEIGIFFWGGPKMTNLLMYSPHKRHELWRFLSYMLLHSGGMHLTLNIIIQILLATLLELEQGSWRCAIVYLGGGLAGALGASVLQPTLYMVGASAGVYALLISHLANVLVRFSQMKYRIFRIFSVGFLAASDIAFSVAHWWGADSNARRIGWAAHCAGALAGATIGILVYSGCDEYALRVRITRWISFALILIGSLSAVIFNVFVIKIS